MKKIISSLLLPPGIFILALLFLGARIFFRKRIEKEGRIGFIIILIAIVFWIFSIAPTADFLTKRLEYNLNIPQNVSADSIILFGGGASAGAFDLSGAGAPSKDMIVRIVAAVRLQKRISNATSAIPIIISGAPAETLISQKFLIDLGAPTSSIILENKSHNTMDNARNTKMILDARGFKNPVLITSSYHIKRSILSFEKVGVKVQAIPADLKNFENEKYYLLDYFPSAGALQDSATALHEYLGFIFYEAAY